MKKILHKDAHGAKKVKLGLSHQLFNCDDLKVDFEKDSKIGDEIFGMKVLKPNMRENTVKISRNPRRSSRNRCKIQAKFFLQG